VNNTQQSTITKKEYERAFDEFAAFLFAQYKKKKQADLTNEPNTKTGQIDNNVS
jgi:hypothetical protein